MKRSLLPHRRVDRGREILEDVREVGVTGLASGDVEIVRRAAMLPAQPHGRPCASREPSLPQVFLKGHIIFPTCIGVAMILGIILQLLYESCFQPWGTVTLKKNAENEEETELQELSSASSQADKGH